MIQNDAKYNPTMIEKWRSYDLTKQKNAAHKVQMMSQMIQTWSHHDPEMVLQMIETWFEHDTKMMQKWCQKWRQKMFQTWSKNGANIVQSDAKNNPTMMDGPTTTEK